MDSHVGALKNPQPFVRILTPSGPRTPLEILDSRPRFATPRPADHAIVPEFRRARPTHRPLRRLSKVLIFLAVLQALDLASTLMLLGIGGIEANPISAWLLRQGSAAFIAVKMAIIGALAVVVWMLERNRRSAKAPGLTWTAMGFDVVYAVTVVSNLVQFAVFA